MSEAEKTIGIFTGVLDVYVARYATEDTTAGAADPGARQSRPRRPTIPRRCLARRLK
jgi:hypothetical protein